MTRSPFARDVVALASLVLIAVGIPLGLVLKAHGVGLPHNDDWVYMLGASSLYQSGSISVSGHSAAVVGQLVMVQPLLRLAGGQAWAFMAFGLGMTAIAIAASYLLARAFLGLGASVMVALLVIAYPGFERQAVSFMTDIPAFALGLVSLLLGVVWLQSGRRAALAGSILVGLLGLTIREFAMVAPAAVLGISLARSPAGARRGVVAVTVLTALAIVGLLLGAGSPAITGEMTQPDPLRVIRLGPTLTTLAALLLPAIIVAVGRYLRVLTPVQLVSALVLVGIAFVVPTLGPLIGNAWTPYGMLAASGRPVIAPILWSISLDLAILAGVLGLTLILHWAHATFGGPRAVRALWHRVLAVAQTPTAVLGLFLVGYTAALAVALFRMKPYDRYLYPMVPVAAIILLRAAGQVRWRGRAQIAAYAALGWLAVSAAMITANSFAYDAARWRMGEAAVAAGYAAPTVNAGYEWVRFQAATRPTPGQSFNALLAAAPCAVVSNTRLTTPGLALIRVETAAYRQFLVIGAREPIYLYGSTDPSCPALPRADVVHTTAGHPAADVYATAGRPWLGSRARSMS